MLAIPLPIYHPDTVGYTSIKGALFKDCRNSELSPWKELDVTTVI